MGPIWPLGALLAVVACGAQAQTQPTAAKTPGERFLALAPAERFFWYEGAFRSLTHLVALYDKPKSDCIAQWYFKDRDAKRAMIEKEIRRRPDTNETTAVLTLLTAACGELVPKKAGS